MVDLAQAHQVLIGDFHCESPSWKPAGDAPAGTRAAPMVATPAFISSCNRGLPALQGTQLSGKSITALGCHLTEGADRQDRSGPRRFRITDKHGLSRHAYNLQIAIELEGQSLSLGLDDSRLPHRGAGPVAADDRARQAGSAPSTEELFDDLAVLLKKRAGRVMTED